LKSQPDEHLEEPMVFGVMAMRSGIGRRGGFF
jgi:hypothetical protein